MTIRSLYITIDSSHTPTALYATLEDISQNKMKHTIPKPQENELLITLKHSWIYTHFALKNDKKQANYTPPLQSPNLFSIS